ncbi:hypothetical protein, partial [Oscillatoria salina]|nr:hypothetical protein [Oscillatoria salina IIICB1]
MSQAIELKITTWVSSAKDTAIAPQPGKRLQTRINLVDGDIENEIGDRFIGTGPYRELRQFHSQQVAFANQTIQGNLQSLQQLFAVLLAWQRRNLDEERSSVQISAVETRLLGSEPELADLSNIPEVTSDLISSESDREISAEETEEDEDWDDEVTNFLASLPLEETEQTKLSPDEIEADLDRERLSASLSRTEASLDEQNYFAQPANPVAPTPEMPVSDLEIEDWEESVPVYSPPEVSEASTDSVSSESLVAQTDEQLRGEYAARTPSLGLEEEDREQDYTQPTYPEASRIEEDAAPPRENLILASSEVTPTVAEERENADTDLEDWGDFLEEELSETEAEDLPSFNLEEEQTVTSRSDRTTTDWEDSDLFDEELSQQETAAEIASWNLREAEDRSLTETDTSREDIADEDDWGDILPAESTEDFAAWELEEETTTATSDSDFDEDGEILAEDSSTQSDLLSEELNEEATTTLSAAESLTDEEFSSPDTDLFDTGETSFTQETETSVSEDEDWGDLEQEISSPDADLFDTGETSFTPETETSVSEDEDWGDLEQEISSPDADLFDTGETSFT